MSRLHKTYIHDKTGAFEAKLASPWGKTVEFEFTTNAASYSGSLPVYWVGNISTTASGPHTRNAFSQAMIQTFLFRSLGVADLPSCFNN